MQVLLWIELVGSPLVLLLLLAVARPAGESAPGSPPARGPLGVGIGALRWALGTRSGRATLGLLVLLAGTNLLESTLDPVLTQALGYDLTRHVYALEGDAVAILQARVLPYLPELVLRALGAFYLAGFVATLLLPLALFHGDGRDSRRVRRAWLGALVANYALALPFYVFVPVAEVGWYGPAAARPMLEELWPSLTAALRGGSALDNCFPSLHVSCTVAAWWCARRLRAHGYPTAGLARAAGLSAAVSAAGVVVLGIHWITDAVAGLLFGVGCAELGLASARRARGTSRLVR